MYSEISSSDLENKQKLYSNHGTNINISLCG